MCNVPAEVKEWIEDHLQHDWVQVWDEPHSFQQDMIDRLHPIEEWLRQQDVPPPTPIYDVTGRVIVGWQESESLKETDNNA